MGFVYGVSELELANEDFYGNFGVAFSSMYEKIDNEIDQVLSDSYLIQGACGDYNPPVRLTEELCNEYHLTCNRW